VTPRKASGLVLALQCAATSLVAQRPGIERLFPDQPIGYVNDLAHLIEPERAASLTAVIDRLRRATGAEIAVVTLPTIGDHAPADVALRIGRKWGVGAAAEQGDPRRNAGVVVLLVPRTDTTTGRVFIATGRGVEGIVTDALAGRVRDRMRPYFQAGRYGEGLELGVRVLASEVARGFGVTDTALIAEDRSIRRPVVKSAPLAAGLVLLVVLGIFVVAVLAARAQARQVRSGRWRGGRRRGSNNWWIWPGGFGGGGRGGWGSGGWGGGGGGGGFGGFGGGGGFSGGGAGGDF